MIMRLTKLFVADNTGAKVAMCIGIRGKPHLTAGVGRIIKVVVKEMRPLSEVALNKEAAALSAMTNQKIIDTTSTATITATMSNTINKGSAKGIWKVVPGKVYNALVIRTRNRIQRERYRRINVCRRAFTQRKYWKIKRGSSNCRARRKKWN